LDKLPVAKIAAESLKFPITHLRALMRRTGIALGMLVVGVGAVLTIIMLSVGQEAPGGELAAAMLIGLPVLVLVFFVCQSMLANGALQVVLDHPLGKVSFSFGGRELRYLLFIPFGFALLVVAGLIFTTVTIVAGLIFGGPSALSGDGANPFGFVIAGLGFFAFFLFLMVRLLPLYGFIAIENRFAVVDAWDLSRGHFWRMLGTLLLVGLAASLISGIINSTMPPTFLIGLLDIEGMSDVPGMPVDQPMAVQVLQALIFGCVQIAVLAYSIFANFAAYGLIFKALREGAAPNAEIADAPPQI